MNAVAELPAPAAPEVQEAITAPEPVAQISHNLIENLNAAVWSAEIPKMNFLYVTNAAQEITGFSPEEWIQSPAFWTNRIYVADRESVLRQYADTIAKGSHCSCEFRLLTKDGRLIWVRENVRVLTDPDGQPTELVGLTIDVTERRRLQDEQVQAQRMGALVTLSSRLAHDLNNMLMIATGYAEELAHNLGTASPMRADIQEILKATERIQNLTTDLLAFTRRQGETPAVVDVSKIVTDVAERLQHASAGVGVELHAEPGIQAKAGQAQLTDFVFALATWASGGMPQGGAIGFSVSEAEITEDLRTPGSPLTPGEYTVIRVQSPVATPDALVSMIEAVLPPKEDPSHTAALISQGYTFVRQWGGDLAVSPAGQGVEVSIYLPGAARRVMEEPAVEEVKPVEEAPAPAPVVEAEPVLETVLVVEDEPGIRALVRKILRRQGYTVLEASNGDEALKVCQEHTGKVDLLITDVIMPQMDGRELAGTLKEQCKEMRVLYVSGYTDDPAIYKGELPAGTAFLQKPFTLGSLLDKVKEVLAQ